MHGHFGYNVSDTMHSIRHLFAKHCKNVPMTGAKPVIEKDRTWRKVTQEEILQAIELEQQGVRMTEIARQLGRGTGTIYEITRRLRRYKDMPPTGDLKDWFTKYNIPVQ